MQPDTSSRKRPANNRSHSQASYLSNNDDSNECPTLARRVQLATYDEDSASNSSGFSEESASSNFSYFSNIPFIDKSSEDQSLNESQNTITEVFKQSGARQKSISLESMNVQHQASYSTEESHQSADVEDCDISQYLFSASSSSFHSFLSTEHAHQHAQSNAYKLKSFPRSKSENHFHERQRECIYQELVSTEKTYVNGLWTLIDFIAQQFKATSFMPPKDLCVVFPSILPRLYSIHAEMLARLEYRKLTVIPAISCTDESQSNHRSRAASTVSRSISKIKRSASKSPSLRQRKFKPAHNCQEKESSLEDNSSLKDPLNVAGILLETFERSNIEFFAVYRQYFNDFAKAIAIFGKYMKRSQSFRRFIKKLQNHPRCANLDLTAFLVTPVQRLPRYLLMVKQLSNYTPVDHPDKCVLKAAQNRLHDFLHEINSNIDCNQTSLQNDRKASCPSVCLPSPNKNDTELLTSCTSTSHSTDDGSIPSSTVVGESSNEKSSSSTSASSTPVTIRCTVKSGSSKFRLLSWFLSRHQRQECRYQSDEENAEHFLNQERSKSASHSQSTFTVYNHENSSSSSMTNLSHSTHWSSATTIQSAKRSLKDGSDSQLKYASSVKDISRRFKDVKASVKSCKRKRQKRAASIDTINKDAMPSPVNRHPSMGALVQNDPLSGENSQQMSPAIIRKNFEVEDFSNYEEHDHPNNYSLIPLVNVDTNDVYPYVSNAELGQCYVYSNTNRTSVTDSGYNGCAPSYSSSVKMNINSSFQLTCGPNSDIENSTHHLVKRKSSKFRPAPPEAEEVWCKSPQSQQRVVLKSQRSFTTRYDAASSVSTEHSNSSESSIDYSLLLKSPMSQVSNKPTALKEKTQNNDRQSRSSIRHHKNKSSDIKTGVIRSASQGHNLKDELCAAYHPVAKEVDDTAGNRNISLSKSFKRMFSVRRSKTTESLGSTTKSSNSERVLLHPNSKNKYIVLS